MTNPDTRAVLAIDQLSDAEARELLALLAECTPPDEAAAFNGEIRDHVDDT